MQANQLVVEFKLFQSAVVVQSASRATVADEGRDAIKIELAVIPASTMCRKGDLLAGWAPKHVLSASLKPSDEEIYQ